MARKVKDVVIDLAEPIVKAKGLELVDVEYNKEGENWILRVFIDKEEGITLEDCEIVSQELSTNLDVEDPIDHSYLLEVSSPGLDRPLRTEEDFKNHLGEVVEVSTYAPVNGEKEFVGELLKIEEDQIKLKVSGEEVLIPRDKIAQTKLAVQF